MSALPCPWCGTNLDPEPAPDRCPSCDHAFVVAYRYRIQRFADRSPDEVRYEAVVQPTGEAATVAFCTADPQRRAGWLEAQRLAASLRHRGIARILEVSSVSEDPPFVVYEALAPETLEERVERAGPLGDEAQRALLEAVLAALAQAHRSFPAIVHGDVMPDKIGFSATDDRPLLFGFGHAARVGERPPLAPRAGPYVATVGENETVTPQIDLYATGRTAMFAATGREPDDDALDEIPASIRPTVVALTMSDPIQRPASADAALRDLRSGSTRRSGVSRALPSLEPPPPPPRATPTPTRWPSRAEVASSTPSPPPRKSIWRYLILPTLVLGMTCTAIMRSSDDDDAAQTRVPRGAPPLPGGAKPSRGAPAKANPAKSSFPRTARFGVVEGADGFPELTRGDRCVIAIEPGTRGRGCRVSAQCAGEELTSSASACEIRNRQPLSASHNDPGGARFRFDARRGSLRLPDGAGYVSIDMQPLPDAGAGYDNGAPEYPSNEVLIAVFEQVQPELEACGFRRTPSGGAQLDIFLDGPTGSVQRVELPGPSNGAAFDRCVAELIGPLRVASFRNPEMKVGFRLTWGG